MSTSTLEVFGHMVVSFTHGVIAFYNPDEPEFTTESLGYNPLEKKYRSRMELSSLG